LSKIGKENGMTANEMSSQTEERLKRLEEGNDIIQRFIFIPFYSLLMENCFLPLIFFEKVKVILN